MKKQFKDSVNHAITKAFFQEKISSFWSETYICIISKIKDPSIVHHFRLISLINMLYKIVAKILANKIKLHLNSLILLSQVGFISN